MVSNLRCYTVALMLGLSVATIVRPATASDWPQVRGVHGSGVSADATPIPTEWSDSKNLQWKVDLPGPGHSCPIVVGDRVFVTCWSGYGLSRTDLGKQEDLKRHLICINRKSGKIIWDRAVPAVLPEDTYRGMFAEHGYTSHTPVSDGTYVFAFFGKSGVFAFDMAGNELWHKDVGSNRDGRGWGTASSLILYKDKVIVTASIESRTIYAFDKETGKEVWRQQADGLNSTWGTPILVDLPDGGTDLVIAVPYEIWGLNPENGKLRWFCEGADSDSYCSSAVTQDGVVYLIEARGSGGAIAVRAGGKGDVTKTNVIWSTNDRGRISSPVLHNGKLYFVSGKVIKCLDAKTGERIYQARLTDSGKAAGGENADSSERRGGFGRGGRGGGMGGQDYSSPVVADNKLVYVSRSGEMFVVELGDEFKQLAVNRFEGDNTEFSATPAISDGQIFFRSNKSLYCVTEQK
jgi:outer membrane protein assembly factor BamB